MNNTTAQAPQTAFARKHPIMTSALNKLYARDNVLRRTAFSYPTR